MWYCKKFTGSEKIDLRRFFLLISVFFYHSSIQAKACTMYMVSASESSKKVSIVNQGFSFKEFFFPALSKYINIHEALSNSDSGEVICFKDGAYPGIRIDNIDGGTDNITLKAENTKLATITNKGYSRSGIYLNNSKNIILSGFSISGGLYGIYATGSSELTINDNFIYDIGQEAIIVKSGVSNQSISNISVNDNVIADTGKGLSQYGEGIYIGDGNNNYNEIINNVLISNNTISNTMNEAIDIKINTKNVTINSNTIINTNLKFNGAITVATSDRFGEDLNIRISNNNIQGVSNRSGYRAIGIAIGQGNAFIAQNTIIEPNSNFAGICLFSTFVNSDANKVTLGFNKSLTKGVDVVEDCGHGGTGAQAFANVIYLTP